MGDQQFIKVTDENDRASSLRIAPSSKPSALEVVGALSHNAIIEPASAAEAQKLLRYAQAALARQMRIEQILDGYIGAALATTPVENDRGDDSDGYLDTSGADLHEDTKNVMRQDCVAFYDEAKNLLGEARAAYDYTLDQAGGDFWLTRNGHGAGFWDRGMDNCGRELTQIAKPFGECHLWIGDDGMIHGEEG